MRSSSSSSSVTVQPLLSPSPFDCSKPETASTGLPNSSSICSRAQPMSCGGDSLFPDSAMETVEGLALQRFVGFLVHLAPLERGLRLSQVGMDAGLVLKLPLGLVHERVELPDHPTR